MSALAVTLGVFFVIFQLRQNAKLIEASNKQIETSNKQVEANLQQNLQTGDSLHDRSVHRRIVHPEEKESAGHHQEDIRQTDWKEFLESDDDYEVRGFLGLYEATGFLAKAGIANVEMLADGMGVLLISDWVAVQPAIEHYRAMWKRESNPNFRWLAGTVKGTMEKAGIDVTSSFGNF